MIYLFDGCVITALALQGHEHHQFVKEWFGREVSQLATCSLTQGTLLRLHIHMAADGSAKAAWVTRTRHLFDIPDKKLRY
jgi:uncharacterized protein